MTRIRKSVLLTALLVVSALTAGVTGGAMTGAETTYQAQDDGVSDAAVDSGEVFWQGQFLRFSGNETDAGEVWAVRRVEDGETGSLVTEVLLDGSASAVFSTSSLDGEFVVVNQNDDPVVFADGTAQGTASAGEASFEVANQSVNATVADRTVLNDDSADARTDLRLQSNRAGYNFSLFSEQLNDSQLAEIFQSVAVRDGQAVSTRAASSDAYYEANFSGVEPGSYDISVITADGAAEDSATVTVAEPTEGTASLGNATYTEERGDVVRFNVTFDGTDRATVRLGSQQVNYISRFTVVDRNGDGEATVEFDTYRAGLSPDSPGISAVGEDNVTDFRLETDPIPGRLDVATYPIEVTVGTTRTAVGSVLLNDRSTEGIQMWTAPESADANSVAQIGEVATQDSDVAFQDWAIVQVQASGLYSYVRNMPDLNDDSTGLSMSLTRLGGMNVPPTDVSLDRGRLVVDESNNQFFVVFDSERLEEGARYQANFTISGDNPYVTEQNATSLVTNFTVVTRSASFDRPVEVPAGQATISGDSTLAPGSELNVEAVNTGQSPFLKRQGATVAEDGTWEASFDFSDVEPNTSFRVSIDEPSVRTTGVVVEGDGAAETEETTPAEEGDEETTTPAEDGEAAAGGEETTPADDADGAVADGEETTEEDAGAGTETEAAAMGEANTVRAPGFGVGTSVLALAAVLLAGAALVAWRR
ncbi:DUF7827 domain-containing protein [Halorussus pelagicus]|uniref:DUF7827 domain-containing protein n=1 Tax=Halorussus pelagicus TaxID=2505977 RepID=UPI000FFB24FB|nr:BGTF surface domain-containing protein [Halorussus pelagicus]